MSNMRIFGLASGMDIDQIVKDLMKAERVRVDKAEQDKQILKWRQELYNELNKDFANFILDTKKDFELTKTTSTGSLINNSLSSLKWVKKASSSDETIAGASSTASAIDGTYSVHVEKLASNFSAASANSLGELKSLKDQFGLADGDVIQFTITSKDGVANTFKYSGSDLTDKTIKDIVADINNFKDADNKTLGVKAVYDENINRFFLQTTETGSSKGFTITKHADATVDFITGGAGSKLGLNLISGTEYSGQDGEIDFAGANKIAISTNQLTINGINLDLKKVGDITVKVDTDIDSVYDKISKFVEKYNELVDKINSKLTEKQYRSFTPLTAEQKEAMSEKEVELWEEKAKSGLLKNDLILSRTMQNVRSWMYEGVQGVTGVFDHLTEIGITTEKYVSGSAGGKLVIDETKLKEAIRDNADSVIELLFKESTSVSTSASENTLSKEDIQTKRRESGIITRLYDNLIAGMKDVIDKAGPGDSSTLYRNVKSNLLIDFVTEHGSISLLDKDISNIDKKLDDLNDYLLRTEDRYYKKFTAMEKAIQQMNSQSSWLAQQLG